jgi:hypothetical protein
LNTPVKLGAFAAALVAIFGGAWAVGGAVATDVPVTAERHATATTPGGGHGTADGVHGAPAGDAGPSGGHLPAGLQVSAEGYTLTPLTTGIRPGEPVDFRFAVTGPDGEPVTDYQVRHEKQLHLIVVSRDLREFQHLHPVRGGDGVWSVRLRLPEAGAYRAFADFAPVGGPELTLGTDLLVAGDYAPRELPAAGRAAEVDGYTVTLDGELVPGRASTLTLTVGKDGDPVTDLQPYLGAYGHLVALRADDLAYLHVHAEDGVASGPGLAFSVEAPSRGAYRLFLDFQHEGTVRTADFTVTAGPASATARPADPATGAETTEPATSSPKPAAPTPRSTASDHGGHSH